MSQPINLVTNSVLMLNNTSLYITSAFKPSIQFMKKFIYPLIILSIIIVSCSKKDPKPGYKIDNENLSLHYDGTHQFEITPNAQAISTTWSSSDTTVGKIDQSGYFTARKIGSVTITGTSASYTLKSKVTVIPYSTMCKEPFYLKGQDIVTTEDKEFRTLTYHSASGLTYAGENSKLRNVLYAFDSNGLTAAALLLDSAPDVINESYQFFSERYTPLGVENNVFFFTDNKNLIIEVSNDATLGFNAIYVDYSLLTDNSLKEKRGDAINQIRINALQALKVQYIGRQPKTN